MRIPSLVVGLLAMISGAWASAQEGGRVGLAELPSPKDLLAVGSKTTVGAWLSFLEGPAFDAQGTLYFSDIIGNRIMRMGPNGVVSVFRADSGRTNGNAFDLQGRLVSCEGAERGPGGRRRIVRTDLRSGEVTVLTDRFQGHRYNSPNDVVVDPRGRIWFTDPFYGDDRSALEMDVEGVYRIAPDNTVECVLVQPDIERPNGLAITPDARTLYLIDSHSRPGGHRKVWAFDLSPEGTPGRRRLVFDFGKGRGGDGLRLDTAGNLWIAAGILQPRNAGETADVPAGIYVLTPDGKPLGRIPIPEDVVTNLAFGGPNRDILHVTAGKTVYKVPLAISGSPLPPTPLAQP